MNVARSLNSLIPRLSGGRRGAASIAAGSAAAQMVAVASAPFLARIYSPSDFGAFAIISALIVTFGTIAALRLELAIPLPAEESGAYSLATLGLWSALLFTVVGFAVISLAGDAIADSLGEADLMPWLWLVPLGGSIMSTLLVLNQLAVRSQRFTCIARRNLLGACGTIVAQIALGLAGFRPGGLIVGVSFGHALGAASLLFSSGLRSREARSGRSRAALRATLLRYRRFALVVTTAGLFNVAGQHILVILVASSFSAESAGLLGLTQRVLALPVTLVGTAIAQVYISELARAVRQDASRSLQLFWRVSRLLAVVAVLLLLVVISTGPVLFATVFGEEWRMSGRFAQALSVGLAGQMIASPLSQTLIALGRESVQLTWDVGRMVSTAALFALCVSMGASVLATVWAVGVLSFGLYGISWVLSARSLRVLARSGASVPSPR